MEKNTLQRISLNKLSIFRDNKAGRVSSINYNVNNGYPRIVVFINGSDRSVSGRDNMIIAPFTYLALNLFIESLSSLITDPVDTVYDILCYNTKYVNNVKTDDTTVQATVTVGKDSNGVIYIAVKADDKPTMRFNMHAPAKWHKLIKNGLDVTVSSEASIKFTKGYVEQLKFCFNSILEEQKEVYTPEQPTV